MTAAQRKRALRRRRRQQQIRRRVLCAGAVAAAIIMAVAFASFAEPKSPAEAPKQTITTEQTTIKVAAETAAPETTTAATQIGSLDYGAEEAYILTKMAMAEAEGEDTEGKALVMLVILNRVWSDKFPDTIEGVISQRNAFTSYNNGRYDRVEPDEDCRAALRLIESHWDESQGALYFERTPEPGESTWHSRNLEKLFTHGNHTFYTEKEASGE